MLSTRFSCETWNGGPLDLEGAHFAYPKQAVIRDAILTAAPAVEELAGFHPSQQPGIQILNILFRVHQLREQLNPRPSEVLPFVDPIINRLTGIYERTLMRCAGPVWDAVLARRGLRCALTPLFATIDGLPDPSSSVDDADLVLAAVLGAHSSLLGQGIGRRFYMTPLRHLYKAIDLSGNPDGPWFDAGCAAAITLIPAAQEIKCVRGMEGDSRLLDHAQWMLGWAGRGLDVRVLRGNLISSAWPNVSSVFAFEPVHSEDAQSLVQRIEREPGISSVVCYAPDKSEPVLPVLMETSTCFHRLTHDAAGLYSFRRVP